MDKVALLTGSALRLGREIALHLAEKGWSIALHFRSSINEISGLVVKLQSDFPNQNFHEFQCDLSRIEQSEQLINQVHEKFGHLDLLINSASIFEPSLLRETTSDLLMRQTMVNFIAPFILMRNYANLADNGLVINMVDARIANNKSDHLAYSLSKKSLWELTKMAALELAPHFRVNGIAPGAILPPAGKDAVYLEKVASGAPMKIPSGVISVLKSIDYIIDNQDLTGQLLFCDGGSHLT